MCPQNNLSTALPAKFKLFNKNNLSTAAADWTAQFVIGLRAQLCNLCLHWNLIPFWRTWLGHSPLYHVSFVQEGSKQSACWMAKAKDLLATELAVIHWAASRAPWPHQQDEGFLQQYFFMNLLTCEVKSLWVTCNIQSHYAGAVHCWLDVVLTRRCFDAPSTIDKASVCEVGTYAQPFHWPVNTKYIRDAKINSSKGSRS